MNDRPRNDEDIARLSPYIRKHINVHGHYLLLRTLLAQRQRALRDPDDETD